MFSLITIEAGSPGIILKRMKIKVAIIKRVTKISSSLRAINLVMDIAAPPGSQNKESRKD
jgi:hypothetical protein